MGKLTTVSLLILTVYLMSIFTSIDLLHSRLSALGSSIDFSFKEIFASGRIQFFPGETITICALLYNTGTEEIEAYTLEASFSLLSPSGQRIFVGQDWNGWDIPPGDFDLLDVYWDVPLNAEEGWYDCEVTVTHKPTSITKQKMQENIFQIIVSPPDIDLIGEIYVDGMKYDKLSKVYIDKIGVQITFVVVNIGSQNAGPFHVRYKMYYNETYWQETRAYDGLMAGGRITLEKFFSPLYINRWYIPHISIDYLGEVAEKNESNNDCAVFIYPTMDVNPDFEINMDSLGISLMPGSSASLTVNVTSLRGFSSSVTLSISWEGTTPSGVSWVFSQSSVVPTSVVTLTFTASSSASPGVFSFFIVGNSGSITRYSKPICLRIIETRDGETDIRIASASVQNLLANKWVFIENPFEGVLYEDALQYLNAIWTRDALISNNFGEISVGLTIQNNGNKYARNVKASVVISGSVAMLGLVYALPAHPNNGKWYSFTSTHSFSIGDIPPWGVVSLELKVPLEYASVVVIYAPLQLGLSPWVMCLLPGVFVEVTVSGDNTNIDRTEATPPGIPLGLYGIDAGSQACQALSTALTYLIGNKANLPNAWEYLSKEFEKFVAAMALDVAVDAITSKITEGAMQVTQILIDIGSGAVKQLSAMLGWKGSSIKLTIISPSGKVYNAYSWNATSAINIYNIEPGIWTFQLYGEQTPEEGEDYSLALVVSESGTPRSTCFLATDKPEYSLKEPVEIVLQNTGDTQVYVDPSFAILNDSFNIISRWAIASTPVTLAPGEAVITYWNQTCDNGNACPNGKYFIQANTSIGTLTTKITIAQPPRITDIKKDPDLDYYPEWSKVTISATVSDEGSGVKNATLYYRTNRDSTFTAVPMEYNFSQQVYEATLPGQPAGTTVEFYILAYDRAGNIAVENNSGIYYNYQVVPEFPSSTILLLMLIVCLTIAILLKRKHQTLGHSKIFF
jgi:hypothetical protein